MHAYIRTVLLWFLRMSVALLISEMNVEEKKEDEKRRRRSNKKENDAIYEYWWKEKRNEWNKKTSTKKIFKKRNKPKKIVWFLLSYGFFRSILFSFYVYTYWFICAVRKVFQVFEYVVPYTLKKGPHNYYNNSCLYIMNMEIFRIVCLCHYL